MDFRGRAYHARIELIYSGGRLPDESHQALKSALAEKLQDEPGRPTFTVSPDLYSKVTLDASIRATSPLRAITRLDTALDDALMTTGLFEKFDVSGKTISITPSAQP